MNLVRSANASISPARLRHRKISRAQSSAWRLLFQCRFNAISLSLKPASAADREPRNEPHKYANRKSGFICSAKIGRKTRCV